MTPAPFTEIGNRVSTSRDYLSLYRHRHVQDTKDYDDLLTASIRRATDAGIDVQAIGVPNAATLAIGTERFYSHVVDTLGIRSLQVNTPFPVGSAHPAKGELTMDRAGLGWPASSST